MDASPPLFWSAALANMAAMVLLVAVGIVQIRRGRVAAHRRCMQAACVLVALFLAAYLGKRLLLGAEELASWSPAARWNLRIHELFVTAMLLSGGRALFLGRRLARSRRLTGRPEDPPPAAGLERRHRRAGRVAAVCAALGLLTACGVWWSLRT